MSAKKTETEPDEWEDYLPTPTCDPNRPWKGYFERPVTRLPQQTDRQWEVNLREHRHFDEVLGIMLFLFQCLSTHLGHPAKCRRGACRRLKKCRGRRDRNDWESVWFGPVVPPCVPDDKKIIEGMRVEIREAMNEAIATWEAEGKSGPG